MGNPWCSRNLQSIKLATIVILSFIVITCKENITPPIDNVEKPVNIPFHHTLQWIERNGPQSSVNDRLSYLINSKEQLDSLSTKFLNAGFLKNKFSSYNFNDSTLIGITYPNVFSSSSNIFIDSLLLVRDSIHVFYHLRIISIYADASSLSDIVSLGKRRNPVVWVPNSIVYN